MSEHNRQALRAFERACVGIDAIVTRTLQVVFRVQPNSCLFWHPHSEYAGPKPTHCVILIPGADGHPKI